MTTTLRTRKQLRVALQSAKNEAIALRQAILWADLGLEGSARSYFGPTHHNYYVRGAITQGSLDAAVKQAQAATRRETLGAVIEGLQLKDYGYHAPGAYYFGGLTADKPGHERLWNDIQAALEVRAEKKREDERQATEKKVAGLTKPEVDNFAVTLNGGVIGTGYATSAFWDGFIDSSEARANAAQTATKPKPDKKKPATKKSTGGKK